MTITWEEIVAIYSSKPWWVWPVGFIGVWFGMRWLIAALRAFSERPIISADGFKQCGVRVDYRAGTITLPRGDTFPVQRVRGMRWEDYARWGFYHVIIDVDDLNRPIHPVAFSSSAGPETFVSRLRTAIEKAGGPRFSVAATDTMEVIERDLSDPVTASVAMRARSLGRRVSYLRTD